MALTWESFVQNNKREIVNRTIGEALAKMVRSRWPANTTKHVAKAWDLDAATAANLVRGSASERTVTKAIKAEGWSLLAPLGEALTGQSYDQFLQERVEELEHAKRRQEARRDRLQALQRRADALGALGDGIDP